MQGGLRHRSLAALCRPGCWTTLCVAIKRGDCDTPVGHRLCPCLSSDGCFVCDDTVCTKSSCTTGGYVAPSAENQFVESHSSEVIGLASG